MDAYLDWSRLSDTGKQDLSTLANALCESVCMVLVYTPTYFSLSNSLCAREYKAMEALERERFSLLEKSGITQRLGVIIPVIFRGFDYIPNELRERDYYNFEDFLLLDNSISEHRQLREQVDKITDYIVKCQSQFQGLPVDPCSQCEHFQLPPEKEIKPWLEKVAHFSVFPGRSKEKRDILFSKN